MVAESDLIGCGGNRAVSNSDGVVSVRRRVVAKRDAIIANGGVCAGAGSNRNGVCSNRSVEKLPALGFVPIAIEF